jgi:hypothetical protein
MAHRVSRGRGLQAGTEVVNGLAELPGVGDEGLLRRSSITRLRSSLRRASLDRALAVGADPSESPLLACRAAQLTSPRYRRKLAAWVAARVAAAGEGPRGRSAAVAPDREEVVAGAEQLQGIQELLRSSRPVYARGAAMLRALLGDGCGNLYAPCRPGALSDELESITVALEGREGNRAV